MAAVGGAIESITLKGRNFAVAADADVERKLGGQDNEVQMNGDGTARLIKTLTSWSVTGVNVEIDDYRNDAEYIQDLKNLPDFFPITITYVSGLVYQGTGQIVDETASSSASATASISLGGAGALTKQ